MGWGAKFGLYKKLCRLGLVWFFQIWKSYLSFKGLTVSILLLLRETENGSSPSLRVLNMLFGAYCFSSMRTLKKGTEGPKKQKVSDKKITQDNTERIIARTQIYQCPNAMPQRRESKNPPATLIKQQALRRLRHHLPLLPSLASLHGEPLLRLPQSSLFSPSFEVAS